MNMPMLTQFANANQKMLSKDLLELINEVRKQFNENPVRLNDFNNRIQDELDGDHYESFVVKNPNGTNTQMFNLDIEQCILIGMRESKGVRKNVLAILKEKQKPFDITNPTHLLQAIEVQAKINIELSQKVAVLEPKADALDVIAATANTYTLSDCCKTAGCKERDLIQLLLDRRWIYREESTKRLQAYADKIQKNIFINKASPVIMNKNDGQERVFLQLRVTAFGMTRIVGFARKHLCKQVVV